MTSNSRFRCLRIERPRAGAVRALRAMHCLCAGDVIVLPINSLIERDSAMGAGVARFLQLPSARLRLMGARRGPVLAADGFLRACTRKRGPGVADVLAHR